MKKMKNYKVWLLGLLTLIIAMVGVNGFIFFVKDRLWEKSVTDIIEVSTQGLGKLEKGLEDEYRTLDIICASLKGLQPTSTEEINGILHTIKQEEATSYFVVDITNQTYSNDKIVKPLGEEDASKLEKLTNVGISEPYYEQETGINVVSLYQPFTYQNGDKGMVFKEIPLSTMAQEYTLSFYNHAGFSYLIKDDGTILIRSRHKNSNRTFQNISEIMNYGGNEKVEIDALFQAMADKKKGVAILSDSHQDENIFCYMPVGNTKNWYLMSIIPKEVIDKQANEIIYLSLLLCFGMLLIVSVILIIYMRSSRKHREEIQTMAYYDTLTSLYNFERFKVLGNKILNEQDTAYIVSIYLDIQGFKALNDMRGYAFGDQILQTIAKCIQESLNKESIAARVSADNFVLLCCCEEIEDLRESLTVLCDQINKTMYTFSKGFQIKMGICVKQKNEQLTINQLIDRSRLAHRIAKKKEVDHIIYNETMREIMINDAKIEAVMEDALQNQEFVTYLQPKYNVDGTQIIGAEALVRWIMADGTMRSPDSFIPLFERNGFITNVDTCVFECVCQFIAACMKQHMTLVPISVNVSRVHLFQDDFIAKYRAIKETYEIPDYILIIEVTETVIAESVSSLRHIIYELHASGFGVAIDDFGAGYSSLNILKELPVDAIKLDREFFSYVEDEKRSEVIINNMVKMAKELNIRSVAEGVETQKQLNFLKQAGCDMIQGYIFAKPMPISAFLQLFDATNRKA